MEKMIKNTMYGEFQNHAKDSQPSEKEFGCTVCKFNENCSGVPCGICGKFKRKEKEQ